jgi:hypothetical protein
MSSIPTNMLQLSKQQPQSSYKDIANSAPEDTGEGKMQSKATKDDRMLFPPFKLSSHQPQPRRPQPHINYSRTRPRTRPAQTRDRHNSRVTTPQWHLRQNTPLVSVNRQANFRKSRLKHRPPGWKEFLVLVSQITRTQ